MASRWASRLVPGVRLALRRSYATEAAKSGPEMPFTFACPAAVFYQKQGVRQIDVPTFSGAFGILPHHVPTLAVLKPGVVTVTEEDGSSKKFFVSSGSVTVNEDSSVQVLAEEACELADIDKAAAKEGLAEAQRALNSASGDKERAEAQISVETFEEILKAADEVK